LQWNTEMHLSTSVFHKRAA